MRGRSHFLISAFACEAIGVAVFKDYSFVPFALGGFAALINDLDHDNSIISNIIPKGGYTPPGAEYHKNKIKEFFTFLTIISLTAVTTYYEHNVYLLLLGFYLSIYPWMKHREVSHSLLASAIFGILCILGFNQISHINFGEYLSMGYLMHILEDGLTVSGVPLFYPFSKKRYKIPLMSTGTTKGNIVEDFAISIAFIAFIIAYFGK